MKKKRMTVLITASGTGSRLGELTKKTNKALVDVRGIPAISRIIEVYPRDTEFVITLGYLAEQVKEHIVKTHPHILVHFVQGSPDSLGASMLNAEELLQCPFVFHCCDTIVSDFDMELDTDWIATIPSENLKFSEPSQYTTLDVKNGLVTRLNPKNTKLGTHIHIGLVGIKSYTPFWKALKDRWKVDPKDTKLSDVIALSQIIDDGVKISVREMKSWYDTGNISAYKYLQHEPPYSK